MLIVESTLLTWSALFDLFFAFEYFYKTQEVVFLVFLYPLIFLVIKSVICHGGGDLSYGLKTLGPLCLWQCLGKSSRSHKKTARQGGEGGPFFYW